MWDACHTMTAGLLDLASIRLQPAQVDLRLLSSHFPPWLHDIVGLSFGRS